MTLGTQASGDSIGRIRDERRERDRRTQPGDLRTAPGRRKGGPSVLSRAATVFLKQREASVLAIAVVLFIYFAATTTAFVSHGSFVNIAQYMAPYVIIGIGLVLLMVCGEIDLSVGFVWMLSPYVMHFFIDSGIPTFLAIVITVLLLAVVIGGINGIVTTVFGVPSLITTLGTGYIIFGYALTISSAQQINLPPDHWGSAAGSAPRRGRRSSGPPSWSSSSTSS